MDTTQTGVIIRDGVVYGGGASQAANVTYDKSGARTSVQSELDTLNSNLDNINVYVSEDGKLHFVDATGADSVLPFSSYKKITYNIKTKSTSGSNPTMTVTINNNGKITSNDYNYQQGYSDDYIKLVWWGGSNNIWTVDVAFFYYVNGSLTKDMMYQYKSWSFAQSVDYTFEFYVE